MTTINPYAAPRAQVESSHSESTVSIDVLKKIRNAWVAGLISGSITLAVTLFAIAGMSVLGYSAVELIDVALVFGLTFGIYKKSRTCAVLMFVYFVISKIILMTEMRSASPMIVGLVLLYFYAMGVVGTFQYHRLVRTLPEAVPAK
jgi:hypothetical protein